MRVWGLFQLKFGRTSAPCLPHAEHTKRGSNMHTFLCRSYSLIVESDEADLVRDVCLDVDKAQTKLRSLQHRLQSVREQAAAQIEMLTAAETRLSSAIVAALLSGQS